MSSLTNASEWDFDLRKLIYLGPSQTKKDCWHYQVPTGPSLELVLRRNLMPMVAKLYAPCYALYRETTSHSQPHLFKTYESELLVARLAPEFTPPASTTELADLLIEEMAKMLDPEEPVCRNGTIEEFTRLMQDISILTGTFVSVRSATSPEKKPEIVVGDITTPKGISDTVDRIAKWFHPIASVCRADHLTRELSGRIPLFIFREKVEHPSAHDTLEAMVRLRNFLISHQKELKLGDRALRSRLDSLGIP